MLKAAIVGCGKIADAHASQIQRIQGCEIVGVCDREPLMARQLYDRFPVKQYFSDLGELLSQAKPDVVHITTPGQGHYELARLCLEAAPMSTWKSHSRFMNMRRGSLILGRKEAPEDYCGPRRPVQPRRAAHASPGPDRLPRAGQPVHMESYYCYELPLRTMRGLCWRQAALGAQACRGNCCTTSSATASPGLRSS